jgi:hypothetical protein
MERRIAGGLGVRIVKLMNGYTALLVFWIRDGTTSKSPSRTFVNFLIVDHRAAVSRPARQYEFPTGYNTYFGPERYLVGEQFFFHSPQLVVCAPTPNRSECRSLFAGAKSKSPKKAYLIAVQHVSFFAPVVFSV